VLNQTLSTTQSTPTTQATPTIPTTQATPTTPTTEATIQQQLDAINKKLDDISTTQNKSYDLVDSCDNGILFLTGAFCLISAVILSHLH
jgi:hypothetical protein